MEATEVIAQILDMNRDMVGKALDGLTDEELASRPDDQCNSIGWLVWHLARAEDGLISGAQKSQELWVEHGWNQKFGLRPEDCGFGDTLEQVAGFKMPPLGDLKAYWAAVEDKTRDFLKSLKPEDLDQTLPSITGEGTMSLGMYLDFVVHEALVHGGQIAYLRGMHRGMGWYY